MLRIWEFSADRVNNWQEAWLDQHYAGLCLGKDRRQFACGEPIIQRNEHGAGRRHTEITLQVAVAIGAQDGGPRFTAESKIN